MNRTLEELVWRRAGGCCEYCRTPQEFEDLPAEIDHIIAEVHGGQTSSSNLALSCLHCNRHKGPNLSGIDPQTRLLVRLFHPRRHSWAYHFQGRRGGFNRNCSRRPLFLTTDYAAPRKTLYIAAPHNTTAATQSHHAPNKAGFTCPVLGGSSA
jgi:hypothetical protein